MVAAPRPDLQWLTARPITHRGLHDARLGRVENCAQSFAAAIAGGFAIECDVQGSVDGEAMVFHDERLERLTTAEGAVRNRTVAALQKIGFIGGGDRMQTLGELLAQVGGRVPLVVEIKSHWDGDMTLVDRVIQLLEAYQGPVAAMSFDPMVVGRLAAKAPRLVRGITADDVADEDYVALPARQRQALRDMRHLPVTKPDFVSFNWRQLPNEHVTVLRRAGCPVISWTIRSEGEAEAALHHCDQITFEGFSPK